MTYTRLQRIKDNISDAIDDALWSPPGVLLTAYLTLTVAANAIALPVIATINAVERINRTERTGIARVIERENATVPHSGTYELATLLIDGEVVQATDRSDLFEGKLLYNRQIRKMEVGKDYRVKIADTVLGPNVISAQPSERPYGSK